MALFTRKSISSLLAEAADKRGLKKTLTTGALVAFGIGAVIGAGLFSITGVATANYAGPSIIISFIIAAVGCAFAGLCYAKFSSMIPVYGSAYTYSYATLGEFVAWIIGWDLVLEYAVGASIVASSWSGYLSELLHSFGYTLSPQLILTPFETIALANGQIVHGIINLPSIFIVCVMSFILMHGIKGSSRTNNIIVALKVSIVLIFIIIGFKYVNHSNFIPFIPTNKGHFGEFGWSGIFRAAGMVFFAYIGFDAVSTTAQETKNPRKSMPIGILGSLVICTILYIAFAYVMTGVANYTLFSTASSKLAPVATAINHMGTMGTNGQIIPAYPWLNRLIIVAILLGYSSVILVMLLGQSRVFYSMSRDGLIPSFFSHLHPKYRTPAKCNIVFMIFVCLIAAFVPGKVIGDMCSIGSLFAFILVCIGIIIVRKHKADIYAPFKTPLVPLIPILGVVVCLSMMVSLGTDTWIRLVMWMLIGFDIYLVRGTKYSKLSQNDSDEDKRKTHRVTTLCGYGACAMLLLITYIHHYVTEGNDKFMVIFSIVFVLIHIANYTYFFLKNRKNGIIVYNS
jgi:basic amino acid/polyamine antiporter, APA family